MTTHLLRVVGVRVQAKQVGKVVSKLQQHLLNLPRLRNVVPDPTSAGTELVLLNSSVHSLEALEPLREQLKSFCAQIASILCRITVQVEGAGDADEQVSPEQTRSDGAKRKTSPAGEVSFHAVDKDNVQQLHELNEKLFPVKYGDTFYEYVADAPEGYFKLACTDDGTALGAVCCEVEPVRISRKRRERLCILTIGVVEDYRRSRIVLIRFTDSNYEVSDVAYCRQPPPE